MAKVGAQRAAELTGKSKSTIQRAMNSGKLSFEKDNNNRRIIDVSELERVYGLNAPEKATPHASVEAELKKAQDMIEMERMKMKIKALEDQLENAVENMEDLKSQRDQWQKQAQQVLITSQHSQKQADESKKEAEQAKAELKERDERAKKRRDEMMAEKMRKMQGQGGNENQRRTAPQGSAQRASAQQQASSQQQRPANSVRRQDAHRAEHQQQRTPHQQAQAQQRQTQRAEGQNQSQRRLSEENIKKAAEGVQSASETGLGKIQGLWKKIKGDKAA